MKKTNCIICNTQFMKHPINKIYCSPKCKAVRDLNKEREIAKLKRINNGTNQCGNCKKEYWPNQNTPYQTFCSSKCRRENYVENNREAISLGRKQWSIKNALHEKEYKKIYNELNKEKIKLYNKKRLPILNEQARKRWKENLHYRMSCLLRHRLNIALRVNIVGGINKKTSMIKLLGCSIDYFTKHLESQFDDEMSWYNYGEWEIDHIIPCSRFDLTKPEEQQNCFNYNNIQPLWKTQNLQKGVS